MSEEKQLTVAELLARAAAEGRPAGTGKRRRRRSVEEGGISVAELTGSIPKVDRKPIESRHSSVPIDEDDPQQESKVHASALINKAEPTAEAPESTPGPQAEAQPEAQSESEPERSASVASAAPAAPTQPAPASAETSRDADSGAPSVEDTAQLSPVKVPEASEKTPKKPSVMSTANPDDSHADLESTATIPALTDAKGPDATDQISPAPAAEVPAVQQESTDAMMPVAVSSDEPDIDDEDEDESTGSMFSVILMAVVGIVLGLVVFIGFDLLWDHLDKRIVAVLALAVTAANIAIVHALRTAKDRLSMALAGLVGLLMTFGPLLIKILQR